MAEVINYVDTDVEGGDGDGSSWANAYATLKLMEDAEDGDWDTANNWNHVYVRASGGTAESADMAFNGSTLSADDYWLIETASTDRASAPSWDVSKYRIEATDVSVLSIADEFVRIDGLQIALGYSASTQNSCVYVLSVAAGSDIRISNCRLKGAGSASGANDYLLRVSDADANVKIWNTIAYGADGNGFNITACGTFEMYNCTLYDISEDAIELDAGTCTIKNCVVFNTADDFQDDVGGSTIDYCASDDNDGTNNVAGNEADAGWTTDFTGAATGDFTLLVGSPLIGAGVADPGTGLFNTDIEGTARGAEWDLGAFEYVVAGGASIVPLVMNYHRRLRG